MKQIPLKSFLDGEIEINEEDVSQSELDSLSKIELSVSYIEDSLSMLDDVLNTLSELEDIDVDVFEHVSKAYAAVDNLYTYIEEKIGIEPAPDDAEDGVTWDELGEDVDELDEATKQKQPDDVDLEKFMAQKRDEYEKKNKLGKYASKKEDLKEDLKTVKYSTVIKNLKDGKWDSSYDVKAGKSLEVTVMSDGGKSKKKMTIMVEEDLNETSFQMNMDPKAKIIVQGTVGINSKPFKKTFANEKAYMKWIESPKVQEDDIEIDRVYSEDTIVEGLENTLESAGFKPIAFDDMKKYLQTGVLKLLPKDQVKRAFGIPMRSGKWADNFVIEMKDGKWKTVYMDRFQSHSGEMFVEKFIKHLADLDEDTIAEGVKPISKSWVVFTPGVINKEKTYQTLAAAKKHVADRGGILFSSLYYADNKADIQAGKIKEDVDIMEAAKSRNPAWGYHGEVHKSIDFIVESMNYDDFETLDADQIVEAIIKEYAVGHPDPLLESVDAKVIRRLSQTGLVDTSDVSKLDQAFKAMSAEKMLTPVQRKLITDLVTNLVLLISGDQTLFSKIKSASKSLE